jgi:hypothetical protein
MAAEGLKPEDITRTEKVDKKEVELQLKSIYRQLNTSDPLEALQVLAKKELKIVD